VVYIAHIVGHEGPNSLLSVLKARNFVSGINCGVGGSDIEMSSIYSMFTISATLTDLGFANWILVADMIFSYLDMLRRNGPIEWIFDELKTISQLEYRYLEEEENESDFVENISVNMASIYGIAREDLLPCMTLFWDWEPDSIQERMTYLTTKNARIDILSPYFCLGDDEKDPDSKSGSEATSGDEDEDEDEDEDCDDDDDDDGDDDDGNVLGDDNDEVSDTESTENEEDDHEEDQTLLPVEALNRLYSGPDVLLLRALCVDLSFRIEESPLKEIHFGTKYWETLIPAELYAFWEDGIGEKYAFSMITPNQYIPQNLEMESNTAPVSFPALINNTFDGGLKLWHSLDLSYSVSCYA
jgi:secreted Zn-dependent insulinase-like peptidase